MNRYVHPLACVLLLATAQFLGCFRAKAGAVISPGPVILQQPEATEPEKAAAQQLADTLKQITGQKFAITTNTASLVAKIIIGPGPAAARYFPEVRLNEYGPEELIIKSKGDKLLLAGGRPRGTLYAVNRFLEQECGARWWAPWATDIPHQSELRIKQVNLHEAPAFEFRDPFCFSAFDVQWKVHNCVNSSYNEIPKELGGCIKYKGHAHTFYPLVPPANHFKEHPEWYSLIKGKRTHERAQLCLTNPELRDFVVSRVKEWLREAPDAQIVSVTQNDWFGWCECEQCKALDDAEGSHAGTMISFVNYIAEKIEPEFPNVWVDTFAYQYTRKPPKTLRPRKNVIVRLCSIECNFREPLDAPSNASFFADLNAWSKICPRLYVWDYTTDFSNYVHPHPNWFTLGPNARVLAAYSAGIFEEGAYAGYGSEMGELRSWLLAKLLWDPSQDDRRLIQEFLEGYYGREAAHPIREYLQLMHDNSKGVYLRCFLGKEVVPYLSFPALGRAERLWQQAERAAGADPEKLARVQQGHLPVRFAFLKYWERLRHECWEQNDEWPLSTSRKQVAGEFRIICEGAPGKSWTRVHVLNEGGQTVETFLKPFATDPPDLPPAPPRRLATPPPPKDLPAENSVRTAGVPLRRGEPQIDLQDNLASLYKPGKFAQIEPDSAASDLRAVRMPANHKEWAFRLEGKKLPPNAQKRKWKVYAVLRADLKPDAPAETPVFTAGVYDNGKKISAAQISIKASQASSRYKSYLVGEVELNAGRDIWVAPPEDPRVAAIWVDRIYLVSGSN